MIKFGPAGASEDFHEEGYKHTIDMPDFLISKGLDTFEYPCGRGVRLGFDTALEIGNRFKEKGIEVSIHAPYFINFATEEEDKAKNNHRYIKDSLIALRGLSGNRCIFHPGSPLKRERSYAMNILYGRVNTLIDELYKDGFDDMYIVAETMGKKAQLGTIDEIISIVNLDKMILPCVDFGHVNARDEGCIHSKQDYKDIIDRLIDGIGIEKTRMMHIHFSKIEYSKNGEVRHLTFDDDTYGPDFEPLMEVLSDYDISARVICESAGTQSRDAKMMKDYYYSYRNANKTQK